MTCSSPDAAHAASSRGKAQQGSNAAKYQCTPHAPPARHRDRRRPDLHRREVAVFAALSSSGASRDRTGDLLLAEQIRLSTRVLLVSRKYLQIRPFRWPPEDMRGRRETNWRPPGGPSAFVPWGGGKRAAPLARLRQLEDAASAKAALASAIAVCASRRGISSNSSITWPYVLRVSRASWPSWRAT
jgi:hypothetical protein